jgi:hypothetical protein
MALTYTPNFQDPRVRRACERAIAYVEQYVKDQPHWLSQRAIQKHFGNLARPLGKYLKEQLLICTDPYFNIETGQCKKYINNVAGLNFIKQHMGIICAPLVIPAEINQQIDSGVFEYKDTGHREYHPLQNLPKRIKRPLLASKGYRHEYDIQCCAQTLLLQQARSLGFNKATPALDRYISDRSSVRNQLSQQLGLDAETIKKILTAILNGASISAWHENMIFSYVNYNRLMISELSVNPYIQQYQKDVRGVWSEIRKHQGLDQGQRFNAKMKSEKYRFLEESVRVVIKRYLKKTKNVAFIEHDGWSCQRAVDIDQLLWEVKQQTGFVIALDWTIHEYIDSY